MDGFRITYTSATPVTTADVTGASAVTVYLTSFVSSYISLFDGTNWNTYNSAEVSVGLGTKTADTNYDVFAYWSGTAVTLEFSAAWTNDTTRADAITQQNGVWCKTGALTRRLVGTIRMVTTTQGEDSASRRFLWNASNRVDRPLSAVDTTNSWTYTLATWRASNNDTTVGTNRVGYVCGLTGDLVTAEAFSMAENTGGGFGSASPGVGVDSTSANSAAVMGGTTDASAIVTGSCKYRGYPGLGFHYLQRLEISSAAGTTTWYGDNGLAFVQTGLTAVVKA